MVAAALVFSVGAFLFAIVSLVAMVVVVSSAARWPGRLFSALSYLILIASIGSILLSERVLRVEYQGLVVASEGDVSGGFASKILLAAVIGCSVTMCIAWWLGVARKLETKDRHSARSQARPTDIILAFVAYFLAFSIVPLAFGEHFYFHVSLVYPFFVFLALFYWAQVSEVDPLVVAKQCLAVFVFASLITGLALPQLAVQPGYAGLIPGFNSRLWGVTAGANSLGAAAGTLLILEAAEPTRRAWLRWFLFTGAAAALVLTQSKTSVAAAMLGLSIVAAWRWAFHAREAARQGQVRGGWLAIVLVVSSCLIAAAFASWFMFFDSSAFVSALERRLNPRAVGSLADAAGRTEIWALAVRGGMENFLFGQGADFWGLDTRLRYGLTGGVHAHNQFLQAFSRSGMVGTVALLVFVAYLVAYAARAAKITRGGSIALLAVFIVRAMFEVPLQPNSILGAEFFAVLAFLSYVIDRGARQSGEDRRAQVVLRPPPFATSSR